MRVARPRRGPHLRGDRTSRPGAASSATASTRIRLTGGEPTVRAHLPVLVATLAPLPVDLSMTTNGATLALLADDLAEAGLRRVNISLDSLRRDRFTDLTRRDVLDRVLDGIDAALAAGLTPVKVNAVVIRGENDDEVVELARFGRDRGVVVRFIEFMPLDADGHWDADQVVPARRDRRRHRRASGRSRPRRPGTSPPAAGATVDGAGRDRRHPVGHRRLLLHLRPRPPHRRRRRSGPACSRSRRPTCGARCGPAPPTTSSPRSSPRPSPASGPATASARSTSCDPGARCPRSAADPPTRPAPRRPPRRGRRWRLPASPAAALRTRGGAIVGGDTPATSPPTRATTVGPGRRPPGRADARSRPA